ncbi:MAG: hypothetical protein IH795_08210 [Bacteroidetes bacterium]|nr:hypothetical protein [Bacteroidota bacterium]
MAVYDLKQAERIQGKFDKKFSVIQTTKKVRIEYAENHNKRFEITGSYYEVNKDENKKFIESAEKKSPKLKTKK